MVVEVLNKNTSTAQKAILELVKSLEEENRCDCQHSLKDAIMTKRDKISEEAQTKLAPILGKYLS